jgi:FkbM family methyltransferase
MHSCTDWALWHAVYRNNEYELNHDFNPEDVVVDIGMQSGSFTCLAYKRGSRNVLGYEMDKGAYDVAVQNVAYLKAGTDIQVFNKAVVGDTGGPVYYVPDSMQLNISGVGQKVESIHFDDILGPLKSVRYLKIDCEGSEWPILLTSKQLHKVQEIAGEYHCAPCPAAEGIPNRTPEALEAFLLSQGFTHTKFKDSGPDIGNFFAWR